MNADPEDVDQDRLVEHPTKNIIAFGFGALTDQMSHQAFQFLIFTFYYAIVGLDVRILATGFIIFAIWDSINDPLLGPISDRTKTRWGRRRFWILVITIPFGLINVLLFTPPLAGNQTAKIGYFILIIMLYDLIYTIFSTNQLALFPEMFRTERERSRGNLYKNVLTILGVLVGFVLPTILINPMAPTAETPPEVVDQIPGMYVQTGILVGVLVVVFGFLFFRFGMKEKAAELNQPHEQPPILQALKMTLKNKAFMIFLVANLFNWFVFKLLTTIIPLYGIHVLGIQEGSIVLTLLLLVALLTAAFVFPLMRKIGLKYGMREGFMISSAIWMGALVPFFFLDNQPILAIICMIPVGIGLSGAMYFVDIIIGNVIDEAELKTGKRSEGAYYGVNALINRYSTILVFVAIAVVLTGYGWEQYLVGTGLDVGALRSGLKILMAALPIAGIVVVVLCLWAFPLKGERLHEVCEQIGEERTRQYCPAPPEA